MMMMMMGSITEGRAGNKTQRNETQRLGVEQEEGDEDDDEGLGAVAADGRGRSSWGM